MSSKKDWKITVVTNNEGTIKPFNYISGIAIESSSSSSNTTKDISEKKKQQLDLKQKKCWEFATSPFRGLFMNVFLMWMIGNQINIFPIIFTAMAIMNPIKAMLGISQAFQSFDSEEGGKINTILPKIVYFLLQCVSLGMAVVKLFYMGLLPNESDWAHTTPLHPTEFVVPLSNN